MFPNRGPFSSPAFFQQVALRGASLGKVYSGDVSFVGDQICKIAEAWETGSPDPRETEIYQQEFNRFYDRIAPVGWKEAELSEYISRLCPQHVKTFNLMRSNWQSLRQARRFPTPPLPPPLPPAGAPVPSTDRPSIFTQPPAPPPPPPPAPVSFPEVQSVDTSSSMIPPPPPPPPPSTPTGMVSSESLMDMTAQGELVEEPCPPGYVRVHPGEPCRQGISTGMAPTRGLPNIPGGLFNTANVANLMPGGAGGFGNFAGLGGRYRVMNLEGGR